MEENPLEQQRIKIDAVREEIRGNLGRLFGDKEELKNKIDFFILQLETLERNGLVFDREGIIKGVREGVQITDRETFIAHLLKVLEPIMVLRVTQTKIFEKIERQMTRQETMNNPTNKKLCDFLYINLADLNNKNKKIFFHLAEARDLITKDTIEYFKSEMKKGLSKLAEEIKQYPNIQEIWASSWFLATPRGKKRIEDLGFTFVGMVSEEEIKKYSPDETRPMAKAFMKRDDFFDKYGEKSS